MQSPVLQLMATGKRMSTPQRKGFHTGLNSAQYNQNCGKQSKLCHDGQHKVCYSLKCSCKCHDVVDTPTKKR